MPTWKLDPEGNALNDVLREFIRRKGIDINTQRGKARMRAVLAAIRAVAETDPMALAGHLDALEWNDLEDIQKLVEDWEASLRRMANERRPPSVRPVRRPH